MKGNFSQLTNNLENSTHLTAVSETYCFENTFINLLEKYELVEHVII